MHVLLTTFNSSFIHKNLALRWLYVAAPPTVSVDFKEYIVGDDIEPIVQMIIKEGYDVVGMSTYIWNVNETKALINVIKGLSELLVLTKTTNAILDFSRI